MILKRKFTLVELLVVIAIIAILASMLMGAVSAGRARLKGTRCTANVKTIITAFNTYANDNTDYYPHGVNWMYAVETYMGSGRTQTPTKVSELTKIYCPDTPNPASDTPYVNSYGWISASWGQSANYVLKVTQVANKAKKAVIFEAPLTDMWHYSHETGASRYIDDENIFKRYGNPPAYIPGVGNALGVDAPNLLEVWQNDFYNGRHALTVNISFADGHAEAYRAADAARQYHKVPAQIATGYGTTAILSGNIFAPTAQ